MSKPLVVAARKENTRERRSLIQDIRNIKNKKIREESLAKFMSASFSSDEKKNFIELVNREIFFPKARAIKKELTRLGITIKFEDDHVILRYPLSLSVAEAQKGISYASNFRDIIQTLEGLRHEGYRKRLAPIRKKKEARNREIRQEYKKAQLRNKEASTHKKSYFIANEIGEKYGIKPETVQKIIYGKV